MARKVEFEFDPFEMVGIDRDGLPRSVVNEAMADIKDYVLEQILLDVADTKSPVTGKPFKKLNSEYAKFKAQEGGTPIANLLLTGDMLDAVRIKSAGSDKLLLYVTEDQSDKADGHNNHSGESNLPTRRFIPDEEDGDSFRPEIRNGIKDIINQKIEGIASIVEGEITSEVLSRLQSGLTPQIRQILLGGDDES